MKHTNDTLGRASAARRATAGRLARLALLGTLLGPVACSPDEILDVPDPDVATPESVQDVAALPALRAGAIGDFALAFGSSNTTEDGLILYTGLFTDELQWAETFPTREQIDRRSIEEVNATMTGLYLNLQRARAAAERANDTFQRLQPGTAAQAEMLNIAGFSYILFGETYCSGVPYSTLALTGQATYGERTTTQQTFELAIARFDSALKVLGTQSTTAANQQRNLAQVGRGRALLNLARFPEARQAVAGVPTAFDYQLAYSENSARQQNGVFVTNAINRRFSVSANEGTNGLPFRADNDPRVAAPRGTGGAATGFDGATPLFIASKYGSRSAPISLANGVEARLIEAEAQLRAGDAAASLASLNTARGTVTGLTPLTAAATEAGRVDQLFRERAYHLFLTGHRLGDLRRLVRQYGRSAESVFPTGAFFKGGAYGTDVNFPIPFEERNNASFQGCINRQA